MSRAADVDERFSEGWCSMPRRRSWLRGSSAIRERFVLAKAMAEERVMRAHAEAAAAFVREVAGELPLERALSIYVRLLDVPSRYRKLIRTRTLALLGESMADGALAAQEQPWRMGVFGGLVRRLRGRRREDLRARVESAASRAHDAVKAAYLGGAQTVASALRGVVPAAEAVQVYAESLGLDPEWASGAFRGGAAETGAAPS